LELYDADQQNYLQARGEDSATIVPDEDGYYTITCLDETVTVNVQHFSNDGGVGLSKGIASATTVASASHTLWVGRVMQRRLGLSPDNVTLTVHVHASGATTGVMTYYAGAGYAPTLTGATTDKSALAVQASGVTSALAYYGGYGYPGASNLVYVGSGEPNFFEYGKTLFARLLLGFNQHVFYTTNKVHDAVDAANSMSAVAAPTTEPTLIAYVNTFRAKAIAHFALGTGAAHPNGADTTNVIGATCGSLSTAITRIVDIRTNVSAHEILHTSEAHHTPGDRSSGSIMPYQVLQANESTAAACTYAVTVASAFDNHLGITTISTTYHAATGSVNIASVSTPQDLPDLIEKANDLANRIEAHAQNRNIETGSAAGFHSQKDYGCKVPLRANDALSVIETLESTLWAYQHHTLTGGGAWHGGSTNNPGAAHVAAACATSHMQLSILNKLQGTDTATPANTMTAVDDLVSLGGFATA